MFQSEPLKMIRTMHHYGFRPGVWAVLDKIDVFKGRVCYFVRFEDGVTDQWVLTDPDGMYEFKPLPTGP